MDDAIDCLNPPQREILRTLASGKRNSDDAEADRILDIVVLRDPPAGPWEGEIAKLKQALRSEYYRERRKVLVQAVKNAEARNDERELAAALEELKNIPHGE